MRLHTLTRADGRELEIFARGAGAALADAAALGAPWLDELDTRSIEDETGSADHVHTGRRGRPRD